MPYERLDSSDNRCSFCGAGKHGPGAECFECELRREEIECRQLRERLFGIAGGPDLNLAAA